jgi:hypothetical protein
METSMVVSVVVAAVVVLAIVVQCGCWRCGSNLDNDTQMFMMMMSEER